MLPNKFQNGTTLVTAKTEICSILRINISTANRKLTHTLKIPTKKMWIVYRMKHREDFHDFLPSLVSCSHTAGLERHSFLLGLSLHTKSFLLHKRHLEFSLINIKAFSHKCLACRNLTELYRNP